MISLYGTNIKQGSFGVERMEAALRFENMSQSKISFKTESIPTFFLSIKKNAKVNEWKEI